MARAKELLSRLSEEECRSLESRALEEMAPNPYWRIFVTRNERGELQPNGPGGRAAVIHKIAEMLEAGVVWRRRLTPCA